MRKILLIIGLIILNGCASVDYNDKDSVLSNIEFHYDNFAKTKNYGTKTIYEYELLNYSIWYSLVASKSEINNIKNYAIGVKIDYYNKWKFFQKAIDSNGKTFDVKNTEKDVSCSSNMCTYTNSMFIKVTRDYLLENINTGFKMKLYHKNGSIGLLNFTPEHIQGFIEYDNSI